MARNDGWGRGPPGTSIDVRPTKKWRAFGALAVLVVLGGCMTPLGKVEEKPFELRSTIVAADGTPIATVFEKNRRAVSSKQIPVVMKNAIVAAEDGRFYSHSGFDAQAAVRALLVDLAARETKQGGSTLSQQLAKMMYHGAEAARTWDRKISEARLAIKLEKRYTKDQILTMYLNRAYFGARAYGVAAAVETYFTRPLSKIRLEEAALLAGLVRAPTELNPFRNAKQAKTRRAYVLTRMRELGMITERQRVAATRAPLGIRKSPPPLRVLHHPYFVDYIEQGVLNNPLFGATREDRERMLYTGGLQIRTTLDIEMQRAAERAVAEVLDSPRDPEVALVAIDPRTGAIKAMVGGRNYRKSQFNSAVQALRQAGSAFKPFVLGAALEAGKSPEDRYASRPTTLDLPQGMKWKVNNFDGRNYGRITLRKGMINSVNGVYARLVLDVGAGNVVDLARRAGITSPLDAYPSIALGALRVGVSPLQMASAYGTFAAYGEHYPPHGILQVRAKGRRVLLDNRAIAPTEAMDPRVAYAVTDVLEDVAREGTARRMYFGRPMGAKTGTTEDNKDAWLVGYTPELVTAVWVGYRKPKPMTNVRGIRVVGSSFPGQIWRRFMEDALRDEPERDFRIPGGMVTVRVARNGTCLADWGEEVEMPEPLVPTRECSSDDDDSGGGDGDGDGSTTVVVTSEPTPQRTTSTKRKGKPPR